jgi:hypothetical protein
LIELRRRRKALLFGGYNTVAADGDLLVFTRELAGERILIALNLGAEPTTARAASGEWTGQRTGSRGGARPNQAARQRGRACRPLRRLLTMSAAIALLALAGCTGDPGPQGPPGRDKPALPVLSALL